MPYPGGPQIDRLARDGDPARFDLPRSMLHSGDASFSFSGLKTAVRYLLPKLGLETSSPDERRQTLADVCASFQEAVVEVLVRKTLAAARSAGRRLVVVSGGVSMNKRLREAFARDCEQQGMELLISTPALCTDNAAMNRRRRRAGLRSRHPHAARRRHQPKLGIVLRNGRDFPICDCDDHGATLHKNSVILSGV